MGTIAKGQRGRSGRVRGQKQTVRGPELLSSTGEGRQGGINGLVVASLNPVRPWGVEAVLLCLAQAARG